MQRKNKFVVIEWPQDLEQTEADLVEEDTSVMCYNVNLWPGKTTKTVNVAGERMRVCFTRTGKKSKKSGGSKPGLNISVMLVEELHDFCTLLSIFKGQGDKYRTSGLTANVRLVEPVYPESPQVQDEMRTLLLKPLTKLRHLKDVKVEGLSPFVGKMILGEVTQMNFDKGFVVATIRELIFNGDCARDKGHFSVATAYYQRASEYFHHFTKAGHSIFADQPVMPLIFEFYIMQHRALNWIEDDEFEDAFEATEIALHVANLLFTTGAPPTDGPRPNAQGVVTKGSFRQWTCQCIREGAARTGQLIKAEDIGRCYYYKSITEHILGGSEAREQADDDKMTGIGCCIVSETMGDKNVPKELLELDLRTIERLRPDLKNRKLGGENEWEDEEGGGSEDDWEDEEDGKSEGADDD